MTDEQIRQWVRQNMAARSLRQEDLAETLELSQAAISARLSGKPGSPPFKMQEIDKLERLFGENSPLRYKNKPESTEKGIDPKVLRAVVRHLVREYPKIIKADPVLLADAIVDLCEYVQQSARGDLSPAESRLAMKRVLVESD